MSIGIPSVASPIGFTGEVLAHGIDGFYAASDHEWESLLHQLITDDLLRRRVGKEARAPEWQVVTVWSRIGQS